MIEKFESTLNGNEYEIREVCRVVDQRFWKLLIKAGVKPVDLYPSLDIEGRDIVVMLFLRSETHPYYQMWREHTLAESLKDVEVNNHIMSINPNVKKGE